jgi:hypothetical protein
MGDNIEAELQRGKVVYPQKQNTLATLATRSKHSNMLNLLRGIS